jgi:hypothetical protein
MAKLDLYYSSIHTYPLSCMQVSVCLSEISIALIKEAATKAASVPVSPVLPLLRVLSSYSWLPRWLPCSLHCLRTKLGASCPAVVTHFPLLPQPVRVKTVIAVVMMIFCIEFST